MVCKILCLIYKKSCHSFTDNAESHLLTLERNGLRNNMAVKRREIWVSQDVYACLLTV